MSLRLRRSTARVLPVDQEGRVLLQVSREHFWGGDRFWLTIGGGRERGETLAQTAAREMREEAGIEVDPEVLGEPVGMTVVAFAAFRVLPVAQFQTYFAFACDVVEVSAAHQSRLERLSIEGHEWLSAEGLERRPERLADPELPRLMRAAVAAVHGPR